MTAILIGLSVPATVAVILLLKLSSLWVPVVRAWPRWQQALALAAALAACAIGGIKPGPTKANLRLLLAERVRLSNGMEYGRKAPVVSAHADATAASDDVAAALSDFWAASNHVASSVQDVAAAVQSPRKYMRLAAPPPAITNHTLWGEIANISVDGGVAEAAVWFNVVPASEPKMRFSFASRTATNRWHTIAAEQSSWPTTFDVGGRECYLFSFAAPAELLDTEGGIVAPLYFEPEIAWGAPETGEPLDLRGGLAFQVAGDYWEVVTGWRTNGVGEVFYFNAGRLADPPQSETGTEAENAL